MTVASVDHYCYLKSTDDIDTYDMTICTPPFSQQVEYLKCGYKEGKLFAMLLPMNHLYSVKRLALFQLYAIAFYPLSTNPDFTLNNKCVRTRVGLGIIGIVLLALILLLSQ